MTTSLPHTSVTRRELSAWLAGIPYVIGFPPTDSLVLMTFNRRPTLTLGTTIRADLPAEEHIEAVTEQLISALKQNEAIAAIAVVVGGGTLEAHRPLIAELRKGFATNDILLVHASWVNEIRHGERWRCYLDPHCTDEIPDPQTSTMAVAAAIAGNPAYRTREEMAEQLTQDPSEALARREELLDAHLRTPKTPYTEEDLAADLTLLTQLLTTAEESPDLPVLNDRQLIRLARALSHQEVKDECMAAALTPNPEAAERLWTVLVRALPSPERAEPAVLLGMSAYLRGAGTLAALAVETALDANPAHPLAQLLYVALTQATIPPNQLRTLLLKSILRNEGLPDDLLTPFFPQETETPNTDTFRPTWTTGYPDPVMDAREPTIPPDHTTNSAGPAETPPLEADGNRLPVSPNLAAIEPEGPGLAAGVVVPSVLQESAVCVAVQSGPAVDVVEPSTSLGGSCGPAETPPLDADGNRLPVSPNLAAIEPEGPGLAAGVVVPSVLQESAVCVAVQSGPAADVVEPSTSLGGSSGPTETPPLEADGNRLPVPPDPAAIEPEGPVLAASAAVPLVLQNSVADVVESPTSPGRSCGPAETPLPEADGNRPPVPPNPAATEPERAGLAASVAVPSVLQDAGIGAPLQPGPAEPTVPPGPVPNSTGPAATPNPGAGASDQVIPPDSITGETEPTARPAAGIGAAFPWVPLADMAEPTASNAMAHRSEPATPNTTADPPTPAEPQPTAKIRTPWSFAKLRKKWTANTVHRVVPPPWPATLTTELNERTAATLGLLTPVHTTLDPLTSFLPPLPEVRARTAPE